MRAQPLLRAAIVAAIVAAMPAGPAAAQAAGRSAEAMFQLALARERGAGDLEGAIQLYKQVAASNDRVFAARALVRLGDAYERLGTKEAQAAYERILRDYADQAEPVNVARVRLAELRSGSTVAARGTPALTMLYADLPGLRLRDNPHYDYSPGGDQIVVRRTSANDRLGGSALEIVNSGGTIVRTLLPAEREMGRAMPRWSPDGRHIAFVQRSFLGSNQSFMALMIVPAGGGTPRVLTSSVPLPNAARGGIFWTPDSRGITISGPTGLVTVGLNGSTVRTVPLPLIHRQQVTGYSPDGRWVVLHRMNEGTEQDDQVDIWLVPATGGEPVPVTDAPGFDGWPAFGADGRTIYFVSDRGGNRNIWAQEIDPSSGRPRGEPMQITSYVDAEVLHPRAVDGGRRLAFALVREMSAVHVGSAAEPASHTVARGTHPKLSPDGRSVYFYVHGPGQPGIFAAPVDGGEPRRITTGRPGGPFYQPYALSRDGASLAYFVGEGRQNVLYAVPTGGGVPAALARFDSREALVPAWSPDGRQLAYAHDDGLFVLDASGGSPRKVATSKRWDGWSVRWSPDGRQLAAFGWPAQGGSDENVVYVVPASGGEPRRLTTSDEPGYKEGLEWHPDGQRLTYMYYGHDWRGDETRVAYLDGRASTKLLDQPYPVWDYVGTWHPDGRRYFLISSDDGTWKLFEHDAQGQTTRRWFGEQNSNAGVPTFSADGRMMAFAVVRASRQVWTIDLATGTGR